MLRTQAVCLLYATLAVFKPGVMGHRLSAKPASRMLGGIRGLDPVGEQLCQTAKTHLAGIRRLDRDLDRVKAQIRAAVAAVDTAVTDIYGVGRVAEASLVGHTPAVERLTTADRYAAYNGTTPIEVASGSKIGDRLSRRRNRTLNHAIHTAAVTQISHRTDDRSYYDRKSDEGGTDTEALQARKARISDAGYRQLRADAERHSSRTTRLP